MHEKDNAMQNWHVFPFSKDSSMVDALRELSRPCARFRSPLSLEERARLLIAQQLAHSQTLESVTHVIVDGTPLNWQTMLYFLHEKGLLKTPRLLYSPILNGIPPICEVVIEGVAIDGSDGSVSGTGFSTHPDPEEAIARAVGEFLERHHSNMYQTVSLTPASPDQMRSAGLPVLDISLLNGYLPFQIAREPHFMRQENAVYNWAPAATYEGARVYLPAQLIFRNYDKTAEAREPILQQVSTNGCGGGYTKDEAILSGVLELIERDGFLIYWLNQLSPGRIDESTIQDARVCTLVADLRRVGFSVYFLDTMSDIGIPSITCVLIDELAPGSVISIGCAAGFHIDSVLLKSLCEAYSSMQFAHRHTDQLHETYQPFLEVIDRCKRMALWRGERMRERFDFFLQGPARSLEEVASKVPDLTDAHAQLSYVRDRLRQKGPGYELYVYEFTGDILKKLGYHVVRTIVPRLIQLYLTEQLATLDAPRLHEVPPLIGYTAATQLNPWPHPFP